MRRSKRILAVVTLVALLVPGARWASLRAPANACACPPAACFCEGHSNAHGQIPMCCVGKGAHCGWDSHDAYLSTLLSTLIYTLFEFPWDLLLASSGFGLVTLALALLPAHARIPEQPPRYSLI